MNHARLSIWFPFATWIVTAGTLASAARAGDDKLNQLVADLGSENWDRRESAQEKILEEGLPLAGLLESAARSENLELAYRARYLLSRIDPSRVQCQVLKVDLDPVPCIVSVAPASGEEGEEMTARPAASRRGGGILQATAGEAAGEARTNTPEEPSYAIKCRSVAIPRGSSGPSRLEVEAAQITQGSGRLELRPIYATRDAIRILRTGEQCLYRRIGLQIERERHRFLTLVWVRAGRRSKVGDATLPADPDAALQRITDQLVEQAGSRDADTRREALEILGFLRARKAGGVFRGLGSSGTDLALAALGLDDPARLAAVIDAADGGLGRSPRGGDAAPPDAAETVPVSLQARAAARLLELHDPRGLEHLLKKLVEGDPSQLHPVMAALADACRKGTLSETGRARVVEAVFSSELLAHVVWEDVETEYLLATATRILDGSTDAGKAAIQAALRRVESLVRGDLGPVNLALRSAFDVWRRLKGRLEGETYSDAAFILDVLPSLKGAASVSEAVSLVEAFLGDGSLQPPGAAAGQVADGDLNKLLEGFLSHVRRGDPTISTIASQALLRAGRVLSPGPGQLRRLVATFVEAGEQSLKLQGAPQDSPVSPGQTGTTPRQIEEQLAKWTGIPPSRRAAGAVSFDAAVWKKWLADEKLVASREEDIRTARSQPARVLGAGGRLRAVELQPAGAVQADAESQTPGGSSDEARPLVYHEFDLLLESPGSVGHDAGEATPLYRVLDGRRIEVRAPHPAAYEDRWGNRVVLRIDRDAAPVRGSPDRFRVNSRVYLFAGLPSLTTVQTRDLSMAWHETSDLFLGSRVLQGGGMSNYRSLYLLDYADREPPSSPAGSDPETLWAWFLENRLLRLPPDASPQQLSGVLGILRTLGVKECAPLLRELLKTKRSVEIAQHLLELGDGAGIEFLRDEIAVSDPQKRVLAALALADGGIAEGIDALAALAQENRALIRGQGYKLLGSIDACLQRPRVAATAREKALELLFSLLDEKDFRHLQHRLFAILSREAGLDFGYDGARGLNDPEERAAAIQSAARRAQEWWQARKAKR